MRNLYTALLALGMAITIPAALAQDEHAGHDMGGAASTADTAGGHEHGAAVGQVAQGGQMCAQGGKHQMRGAGPHRYRHGQHAAAQGGCGGGHQHGAGGQCATPPAAEPGA